MGADDYASRYPWQVDPNNGGTLGSALAWQHLAAIKDDISTPGIFMCPSDIPCDMAFDFSTNLPPD
jgi:hypothetical protein